MKKVALVFVIAVMFVSCKQSILSDSFIYFNQPQPDNVDAISSFPKKYLGTFSMDDSHQIVILPKAIFLNLVDTMEVAKKDIDSIPSLSYKNDQITDKETGKKANAWVKNDTIYWEVKNQDTIFSFSENEIAKVYKSSLILNKKVGDNYQVSFIKFNNKRNKFIQLGTKRDAALIQNELKIQRDIIVENGDTTHVILTPTRSDFRKLLRLDGIEYQSNYHSK